MKRNTLQARLIAIALLALGASTAQAQGWGSEIRQDNREIRQDRQELRSDYRELERDRADYARAQARGDIFGMARERMEIRQDKQEIRRDQAELRSDLRDRRQDARGHQGYDGRNQHAGYWNQG
jgi:flagellar biosynthesis chaperone FliJ